MSISFRILIEHEINNAGKEGFEQEAFDDSKYTTWINGAHGASLLPAFQQVREAMFRTRSQIRALRIISALCVQADAESKTISPDFLAELGVPKSMTLDMMNGEPMKINRVHGKWVVYSVGPDLKDDGGKLEDRKEIEVGWEFD